VFHSPPLVSRLTGRPPRHRGDASGAATRDSAPGRWPGARRRLLQAGAALLAVVVTLFAAGAIYLATLPSVGDARQRVDRILALHNGTYAGPQPALRLGDAVVAVEDEHFYSNFLINILDGAGRAALATLQTSQDPGGSTIAQQLAKQLYGRGQGLAGALRDIGLGVKLSLGYPKPQILNMYLNSVYYGHGYWGDGAAARGYFGTTPAGLDWARAAMLAGLPVAPSAYDPLEHYALAKQRQEHVLDQLVVNHYLTAEQAAAAYAEPLHLR
jgi:membrane carboxypeptidase/penicillin-binding protein PbpC